MTIHHGLTGPVGQLQGEFARCAFALAVGARGWGRGWSSPLAPPLPPLCPDLAPGSGGGAWFCPTGPLSVLWQCLSVPPDRRAEVQGHWSSSLGGPPHFHHILLEKANKASPPSRVAEMDPVPGGDEQLRAITDRDGGWDLSSSNHLSHVGKLNWPVSAFSASTEIPPPSLQGKHTHQCDYWCSTGC